MRLDLLQSLAARVAKRERAGLLRRARTVDATHGVRVMTDGRELLNFCSNDYLGLAQDARIIKALQDAANECGVGSTAAHLVCGHRREHARLEEALCEWTGREAALLFSSGWLANLGAMQALLDRDGVCVQDKLNHASLLDAAQLAGATLQRYPHADAEGAARQLASATDMPALLATDGVFSMDGDIAPLRKLSALCACASATLMIDDAHGLGVLGQHGAGSVDEAGLSQDEAPVLMATLGKALGCMGAFVAGSRALIEGLTQFARTFVYTTALPPALAAAASEAVRIARAEDWRRDKLRALIARFRNGATQLDLPLLESRSAIQPIVLGDAGRTIAASRALEAAGFLVTAIRPPTVPQGKARLRVTLSAAHEEADVDRLLDALSRLHPRHSGAGLRASAMDGASQLVGRLVRAATPIPGSVRDNAADSPGMTNFLQRVAPIADMPDLYIHTEGHGDTQLVLLHGWAMHGGVFAPLMAALRERCTLHVVDLPGHGRSRDCAVSLQPAACAQAIAARVPPAIWLGWSLGGLYALQAALDFPQQVQGLAMLCASPRFVRGRDWPHAVSPGILQDFGRDLETDYEGTLERFLALEALGSDCAQADLRKLRADTFNEHPPVVRALTEGLDVLEHTDLRARLPELVQPSAWIAGRRDRLIPWQAMRWSASQCGGAFTCITGGGHAPFIGHTGEVAAALAPLLAAQPA